MEVPGTHDSSPSPLTRYATFLQQYLTSSCLPTKHAGCVARFKHSHWQGIPDRGRGRGDASPAAAAVVRFEHYMMPYVRFPFTGPVVAMKMLSFRLKGGARSPGSKRGGGGGDRSGSLCDSASYSRDVS